MTSIIATITSTPYKQWFYNHLQHCIYHIHKDASYLLSTYSSLSCGTDETNETLETQDDQRKGQTVCVYRYNSLMMYSLSRPWVLLFLWCPARPMTDQRVFGLECAYVKEICVCLYCVELSLWFLQVRWPQGNPNCPLDPDGRTKNKDTVRIFDSNEAAGRLSVFLNAFFIYVLLDETHLKGPWFLTFVLKKVSVALK